MASGPDPAPSTTEFTDAPVPREKLIAWWNIALIKIGVVLALPGFLIGAQIGNAMGLRNGAIAFFGGAAILAAMASLTGTVAARTHLPTSVITQFSFGRDGARLINLILAITLVGWFAVTAEIFGGTLAEMAGTVLGLHASEHLCVAIGGLLMVATTMFGFKAISRLAELAVPLLLLLVIVVVWLAIRHHRLAELLAYPGTGGTAIGIGISAVVGGASVGTIIFPDIARFARSARHGRGAAIFTYAICLPSMLMAVAIASVATGESNIMMLMLALGLGGMTLAFLVFKAWTTNVGNLYSSSLFAATFTRRAPFPLIVLAVGIVGTLVAMFGLTPYLVPFLLLLGITIPPIAGIYVTDFFLRGGRLAMADLGAGRGIRAPAFIAWAIGTGGAALSSHGVLTMSGIPACDSITVAAATYFAIDRIGRRYRPRPSPDPSRDNPIDEARSS